MAVHMTKGFNMNNESLNGSLKAYFGDRLSHYLSKTKISNESKHIDFLLDYIKLFKRQYKSIECDKIINTKFTGWESFQTHMESSNQCKEIIQLSIDTTSEILNRLNYEKDSTPVLAA